MLLHVIAGALQLNSCVVRILEAWREGYVRMRGFGNLCVANERQDRVIERRRGDLDLPLLRKAAIDIGNHSQLLQLLGGEHRLVCGTIIAFAPNQFLQVRIVSKKLFVKPGQLREHLQVAKGGIVESAQATLGVFVHGLPSLVQLAVSRVAIDHPLHIGLKEVAQNELAFAVRQAHCVFVSAAQEGIDRHPARILVQLHEHRRHQVKSLMHLRKIFKYLDHAVVVLERVQAGPGQLVFTRYQILVKGLVHVPDER